MSTITSERRAAFRFFLEHAGYATPPGRAVCALELARAESTLHEAINAGVASVAWVDDEEPYDPGDAVTEENARALVESGAWTGPFGCVVDCDNAGGSLWGIMLDSRGTGDPYARVVAAELASEIVDALRQAIGDARDEEDFSSMLDTLARAGVQRERIDAMRATHHEFFSA
jgi:hypothetical protein